MSSESMFDKLDRYYHEQNISVTKFGCKHEAGCKAVCKDFVPMREAFVGEEYENGSYPRLLFVSSDSIGSRESENRTLKAMRDYHQNDAKIDNKKGHWYQTNALARLLLGETKEKPLPFGIDKTCRYFAFVNSAKCKDFSGGQREGHRRLFLNCREFIQGEVNILQPDIIVAQGKKAKEALWLAKFPVIHQVPMPGYPETFYEIVQLEENHQAIKTVAKHPCAHSWKPGEKKQFMDWAAKSVQKFITVA